MQVSYLLFDIDLHRIHMQRSANIIAIINFQQFSDGQGNSF